MYHGYDWYGRALEVREVSHQLPTDAIFLTQFYRTALLVYLDQDQSVEAFAVVSVVVCVVPGSAEVFAVWVVDSEVVWVAAAWVITVTAVDVTSTLTFTRITLAPTKPRRQAFRLALVHLEWITEEVLVQVDMEPLASQLLNQVSKLWSAM